MIFQWNVRKEALRRLSAVYSRMMKTRGEAAYDDEEFAEKFGWIPNRIVTNYIVPASPADTQFLKYVYAIVLAIVQSLYIYLYISICVCLYLLVISPPRLKCIYLCILSCVLI